MEMTETVRKMFQEMIVPELGKIREENHKIVAVLELTNKRLDDVNTHLADQSRRIDELRAEMSQRIDDTNKRIEDVRSDVSAEHYVKIGKFLSELPAMDRDLLKKADFLNDVCISHTALSIGATLYTENAIHFNIIGTFMKQLKVVYL